MITTTWAQTVAAELEEAERIQQAYREYLHEVGSCGGCEICDGEADLDEWEREQARLTADRHAEDLHATCFHCGKLPCRCHR